MTEKKSNSQESEILSVIEYCLNGVLERPVVEQISHLDEYEVILARIGNVHRDWLTRLWKSRWIEQEPIVTAAGEILAEPIFWFKEDDLVVACFGEGSPDTHTLYKLEDAGIQVIRPGQQFGSVPQLLSKPAAPMSVPFASAHAPTKAQTPTSTGVTKPCEKGAIYKPKYVSGYWCVTRYAVNGKAMPDRQVFPTKEAAEKYAATMRNALHKPTIEQLK
jgi:hypothetical protein